MSAAVIQRCRWRDCARQLRWAVTARGRDIPLDMDPVQPGTKGALVLVGERALGLADAVQRLGEMFDVGDDEAHRMAMEDYGWHLAHFATCPHADRARRRR